MKKIGKCDCCYSPGNPDVEVFVSTVDTGGGHTHEQQLCAACGGVELCAYCKKKPVAYEGAVYCGAACTARAEAKLPRTFTAQPAGCPKLILVASHFNNDGTCKCTKTNGVGKEDARR